jgi:sugar phosphate isomerase/epimerase
MVELLASFWTIAGDVYPTGPSEVSPFLFRDRVAAAAEAGFTGIGLVHADVVAVAGEIGLPEMARILQGHGIRHVELEFVQHWYQQAGPLRDEADRVRRDLFVAAEVLGARDVKIAPEYGAVDIDLPRHIEAFASVCRQAREHGTLVALEVMPFSNVATLETAMAIVEGSGVGNGGLLLDIWHVERGGISPADVAALPPGAIVSVELDDAALEPVGTLFEDTVFHRRCCGEGAFDIPGFIAAVDAAGYTGPYGVEVISAEHRMLPLGVAARKGYDTTIAQFAPTRRTGQRRLTT